MDGPSYFNKDKVPNITRLVYVCTRTWIRA